MQTFEGVLDQMVGLFDIEKPWEAIQDFIKSCEQAFKIFVNFSQKFKCRLLMLKFDEDKYHKRLVETVISVKKRVFGDTNHSRSDRLRNKESKLRNVCYNIHRYLKHLF